MYARYNYLSENEVIIHMNNLEIDFNEIISPMER